MKKYFYLAAIALTAALTFTACGDDDPEPTRTFASADFSVYSNFNDEAISMCDVTWTITDWEGKTTTIKGAAEDKSYEFKTTKSEATATITYTCAAKANLTPDNKEHILSFAPHIGYEVLDNYGAPMENATYTSVYGSDLTWGSTFVDSNFVDQVNNNYKLTKTYTLTLKNNHISCVTK